MSIGTLPSRPTVWIKRASPAADMVVDQAANELYVADGYFNHRVVVFDATPARSSALGCLWQAAEDEKITYDPKVLPQQFNNPVHGIRITADGQVVVSDVEQPHQVFRRTVLVREIPVLRDTTAPA